MIGTIEELRRLINDAAMRRPHLTGRLEKAAFLVLLRPIHQLDGDVWRVGSEDRLRFYTVRDGECECSDYLRHGSGHPASTASPSSSTGHWKRMRRSRRRRGTTLKSEVMARCLAASRRNAIPARTSRQPTTAETR